MDFADKIKFLREKILDMTQVELAKRLCVTGKMAYQNHQLKI